MALFTHLSLSFALWSHLCENLMEVFKSVSITKASITWPLTIYTLFCSLEFLNWLSWAKQFEQLDLTSDEDQKWGQMKNDSYFKTWYGHYKY